MSLEALSSNEFLNFIIYDTLSAPPPYSSSVEATLMLENIAKPQPLAAALGGCSSAVTPRCCTVEAEDSDADRRQSLAVQRRRKKSRRRPRVCKNKAEAETQRMTHIRVERNRRKQMNDHLAVLRSLMPESYVKRGDQASIVGGAIEFVKELEHLLQSLEAQKLLLKEGKAPIDTATKCLPSCFEQFFAYPQYSWSQNPNKYSSKTKASVANIEVTLIETHANLRILLRRSLRQLSKIVTGFQTLYLTILHLNITTLDPLVLYSISAKVEEGCQLSSADDIAAAVHHMLRIIEEAEATLC